mmetsp:Transcript_28710/g.80818  ORF Transcript_28710/g.80818 Transcript_28710/m.80818 type:complete len:212 (+) Transcript_28710:287-922(+)
MPQLRLRQPFAFLGACAVLAACTRVAFAASHSRMDSFGINEAPDRKLLQTTASEGYCTWGSCDGNVAGGNWCNNNAENCGKCSLTWCVKPAPQIPEHYGYCQWGKCSMAPDTNKWCGRSPTTCESSCKLTWCPTTGYCTFSACNGEPKGGAWCNAGESRCSGCGGSWCTLTAPTTAPTPEPVPEIAEFFGWDPTLPNVVKAYLDVRASVAP